MQRHPTPHHQPPLLAIKEELRLEHRPRLSLSVPHIPGKTRKRHKVATSCNRCRQNKRKCDGGVPCSNCKRNKADCLYTDAQQSRSTWGDLPLSQEKIIGVSASASADDDDTPSDKNSKSASTSAPGGPSTTSSTAPKATAKAISSTSTRVPKSTAQPSSISAVGSTTASKSPINQPTQKGSAKQSARIPDNFVSPFTSSVATLAPQQLSFIPGHATYEQDFNLDRRKQQLGIQSTQISRAIRVTRSGPFVDTSILLDSDPSNVQRSGHNFVRGLSQDSSLVTQGPMSTKTTRPRVTASQSVPNAIWQQDLGTPTSGSMLSLPKQQQQQLQPQYSQQPLLHHQQYHTGQLDSLETRQTGLSPAQPIPQYSDSPKSESISASTGVIEGNSRLSLDSTHSLMNARIAPQPQPTLQQPLPQQRQQNIQSTDTSTSGCLPGTIHSQGLQQNNLTILNEQFSLYDSPHSFGTPQAHFPQQSHQQIEQQHILQLPVSPAGQHQQQQQSQTLQGSPLAPNHSISSAAPVSSIAVPSGVQPALETAAWVSSSSASNFSTQSQLDWKGSSIPPEHTNRSLSSQYSLNRSPVTPATSNANATSTSTSSTAIPSFVSSPVVLLTSDHGNQQTHWHNTSPPHQQAPISSPSQTKTEEPQSEASRMQKIARDILDCQRYDYSVFLPRHISQEYPELWIAPHSNQPSNLNGIPRQLLVLPKDANFLVDVFFENACFYYPILNRTTVEMHLMEPHTAHSLFLLNIIFMTACKHLGKSTYIKRAIQFRERARELQYYIDGTVRLSRIQGALLGSQVIYGVFMVVIGFAELCGSHCILPTVSNRRIYSNGMNNSEFRNNDGNETVLDIAEESRKLVSQKGTIPEAAYQQRLWSFWTIFARDSMARLYFGWPHGTDALAITAELPTIKGFVGLGGRRKGLNGFGGHAKGTTTGVGKRRGAGPKPGMPERKVMKATDKTMQQHKVERETYRATVNHSDDDDDDDDYDATGVSDVDDDSDLEQGDVHFLMPSSTDHPSDDTMMKPTSGEKRAKWSFDGPLLPSSNGHDAAPSISGLSKTLLEKQGRGEDIHRRPPGNGAGSNYGPGSSSGTGSLSSPDIKRHTERMRMLLDAEDDLTDGGTYSRILFLEEIKLWTIGRRVGLYLMGRAASTSANPLGAMTGSCSTTSSVHDFFSANAGTSTDSIEGGDPFATTINTTVDASQCSQRAWLEDKELQGLQAELIAWDQALPPIFKFRPDVDAPDINHKVNGKLAVLSLFYYTITILLQSSYLPIPQYLSSSSRSTAHKSPESISQEYDDLFSRSGSVNSTSFSDDGNTRVKREGGEECHYPNRVVYLSQQRQRNNSGNSSNGVGNIIPGGYFNTAHKICTELSNVLYHHLELMLDSYPNWCSIQSKLNQSLIAALRVSCLNARLSTNSQAIRDEAKAGFKMGSHLFKRQALLPDPLTIRDWPAEEDVQVMLDLEEEFRGMMTTQEEEERSSRSNTRDQSEDIAAGIPVIDRPSTRMVFDENPGDRLLYIPQNPDDPTSFNVATTGAMTSDGCGLGVIDGCDATQSLDSNNPLQYGMIRAEHVFGLSEGFQFDYSISSSLPNSLN
ncbi:hypothetical protein FBU30_010921 [Linnemannia zychae]|nr:hypothetical protein FBU30_010921 [Linnemannia zychae]